MIIDLVKDDGLAQILRQFPACSLVCLLQVNDQLKHLAAVRDRNCHILPLVSLFLINLLHERIYLLDDGIHSSRIHISHVFGQ